MPPGLARVGDRWSLLLVAVLLGGPRARARASGRAAVTGVRGAALAVAARPSLWPTAVAQLFVLAPRGWWRRRPYIPTPDPDYLAFRLQTMYGDPDHVPEAGDVVTYLKWCRTMRGLAR